MAILSQLLKTASLVLLASVASAGAQTRNWILSREVTPADVLAHFPLQVGNRWIYETKSLTGDPDKPHLDRWIWELQVTKHLQTSDGLIVFRERRDLQVLEGKPDESLERADPYLVRNGYVFGLSAMDWDESRQSVDPEFFKRAREESIKRVKAGQDTPEFFFPMQVGLMWAEREQEDLEYKEWISEHKEPNNFYHWDVVAKGGTGHCDCMKLPADAFDVLYFTNGGPSEVFFQDGVGVIGEWNIHQGTYWEKTTTLKQFIPIGSRNETVVVSAGQAVTVSDSGLQVHAATPDELNASETGTNSRPAATETPTRVYHMDEGVMPPQLIYQVGPKSRRDVTNVQGTVLLEVVIDEKGLVSNIRIARSLDPALDQSAKEAVGQWRFKPAMKDGKPVAVETRIEVTFRSIS